MRHRRSADPHWLPTLWRWRPRVHPLLFSVALGVGFANAAIALVAAASFVDPVAAPEAGTGAFVAETPQAGPTGSAAALLWLLAGTTLIANVTLMFTGTPRSRGGRPSRPEQDAANPHEPLLQHIAERMLTQAGERAPRCAVLMIAIDGFAALATAHGRSAADTALATIEQLLHDNVRASDIVGRAAGDSFAVVLAHTDPEVVLRTSRRIRDAIARIAIPVANDASRSLTASVGIAVSSATDPMTAVLDRASEALQDAVRQGPGSVRLA